MKKIIIVGHKNSNYRKIEQLLQDHGMAAALPSRREGLLPSQIGEVLQKVSQPRSNQPQRIVKTSKVRSQKSGKFKRERYQSIVKSSQPTLDDQHLNQLPVASSNSQITVNPMWNGLAMDLILSNIEQEFWGWADPQAIHLLNYWAELDPSIHFVFVYDKPQSVLVGSGGKPDELDAKMLLGLMNDWEEYNKDLLHFFHRNKNRCVLVNGEQMLVAAEDSLAQVKDRIEAPWKEFSSHDTQVLQSVDTEIVEAEAQKHSPTIKPSYVSDFIALSLIKSYPEALSLYEELQASANLPLFSEAEDPEFDSAIYAWNDMVKQERLLEEQQRLSDRLTKNVFEAEKLAEDRHYLLLEEKEARKKSDNRFTNQVEKLSQESEALLTQLHGVQQTLEIYYSDKVRVEHELNKLVQSKADLENEQKALLQKQKQVESNLLSANEKLENVETHSRTLESKNKALSSELAKAGKKLDEYHSSKTDSDSKLKALAQAKNHLENEQKGLLQKQQDSEKSLRSIRNKLQHVEVNSKELESENASLLSQLHEVQVELERFYLENKMLKEKPPLYGAADRIRQQLTYRIGATLLENSRSFYGWLIMPFSLIRVTCQFRRERRTKKWAKLPPVTQYQDAYDAIQIKNHLSYRLGMVFLKHIKNPFKWFTMPVAIKRVVKEFRQSR